MTEPADSALLAREAASFVARLRLFTPARWAAAAPVLGSRADVVHHLCRRLAEAAGEAPGPVPRLDADLALPDQLAVTADDLVRTGRDSAAAVAHLLLHRRDVLDEPVPTSLVRALGDPDEQALLARARQLCAGDQLGAGD